MTDSGIARRVDQLGRIVLPMEIRKKLKIVEGTLLNLYCDGSIITLEKYSPLLNFKEYVEDILCVCDNLTYLLCDDTSVILANKSYKGLISQNIDTSQFVHTNDFINEKLGIAGSEHFNYHLILDICKDGDKFGYLLFSFENVPSEEIIGECKFICKYISSKL